MLSFRQCELTGTCLPAPLFSLERDISARQERASVW
jgi:hypothetical protein